MPSIECTSIDCPTRYAVTVVNLLQRDARGHHNVFHLGSVLFEEAMRCFEEAEKMRPPGNDDSVLRWNRCIRLLHSHSAAEQHVAEEAIDFGDSKPY